MTGDVRRWRFRSIFRGDSATACIGVLSGLSRRKPVFWSLRSGISRRKPVFWALRSGISRRMRENGGLGRRLMGDALDEKDEAKDEDAYGSHFVDDDQYLEIEAVAEMRRGSGDAVPVEGRAGGKSDYG